MKLLIVLFLYITVVFGLEHKTDLTLQGSYYDENERSTQLLGNTELTIKDGNFNAELSVNYLYTKPYAMQYVNLNTLFIAKETKAYTYKIGKMIKYWGALEGFNITDVFNVKNYLLDPFDKSKKIGSWGMSASTYVNDNNMYELAIKFYEEDQHLPALGAPFNPLTFPYNDELNTSTSRYHRNIYISYSLTTEDLIESESTFIVQNGYDNKRYYSMSEQNTLVQNAYKCNKYMFFSNILIKDTSLKFEGSFTKINDNVPMSDYKQYAVGIEHNINDVFGVDIGLYAEYYNYYRYDNTQLEQVDISEIYDNDILIASKFTFNDTGSSEFRIALLNDLYTDEKLLKVNAKTRIKDKILVNAEYIRISNPTESILATFKDSTRIVAGISYSF